MRIGEVAKATGTTTRTVRYYEEIGLLGGDEQRAAGKHRDYDEADVERIKELLRLKNLLGVSLDELKVIVEAEDARAALRDEWHHDDPDPERQTEILEQARAHIDEQLALVRRRASDLGQLEASLLERREKVEERMAHRAARS